MIETTQLFDDETTRMLRSFIGWTIDSYEAYLLAEGPDIAYKRVRLDLGGVTLDLANQHRSVPLGPQAEEEELAILSAVDDVKVPVWCPRGRQTTKRAVNLTIDDILLVTDTATLRKGSLRKNKLKLVQAVIFRSGATLLAIDRDVWYDENLIIRQTQVPGAEAGYIMQEDIGPAAQSIIRDCEGDWVEDAPFGYEFERQIMSIGGRQYA